MKKFLLLLTLLCTLFSTVKAVEVQIGDLSAATANTSIPFSSTFNYGFSQQIYSAEEIAEAGGSAGTINSLTLWMYNTSSITSFPITIYMTEVSDTAFASTSSWITLTASDLVYTGTLSNLPSSSADVAAVEITLDSPFSYSGTGNLVVAFTNGAGTWNSGFNCMAFGPSSGTYKALYKNQDGGAIDPTNPGGISGTRLTKRNVIMLDLTPSGGPVVQCDKPETCDITDVTSTSAVLNLAGGSGRYNVEIKGGVYEDWTLLDKTSLTTYPLSNLAPYTSYQVRAQSVCDGGNVSGYKTASFKTLIGIPFADGLGTQGDWTKATGLLSQVMAGTAQLSSGGSWYFGARTNQPNILGGPHAYMNLYSTTCKHWIISPFIPLPEGGNYVLTYQVALTDYGNEDPIEDPTSQQDDKLVVLISTDSCRTWNILQQWDNAGSAYVYNQIPVAGEEVEIDLSVYAGQEIQIAFYGESTVSGGDNDIHVGHVLIDYAPDCMTPDSLRVVPGSTTKTSAQIDWHEKSGATEWILQYKKASDADYASLNVTTKPYQLQGLQEFTEYNVRIAAKCSDAEDGTSKIGKPITFKTASGVPFVQSFDTATMPNEWVRYEALLSDVINEGKELEATKDGWNVGAANGIFPSADNHLVINLKDTTTKHWILGPTIEMAGNQQLTFDLALTSAAGNKQAVETGKQNSQKFYVFLTTNGGNTWTTLAQWTNAGEGFSLDGIKTESQTAKIDLTAYATNSIQLAFYAESGNLTDASNNLHIANVKIDSIPACQKANSLAITGIQGTVATAVWESDDDATWQYGYVVKPAGEFVPADSLYMGTTTETSFAMTGLFETTHYIFFVRRVCDNNEYSEPLISEFATIQTPTDLPYEHDFESGNGWRLINGDLENHWVWDENASANNTPNGSKALYISNDNLGTYAYTRGSGKAAMVYATKTFYFDQTGQYSFQYDWKCWGYSTSDYLRVALIDADVELEAATTVLSGFSSSALPEGWVALDGGSKLNLDSAWNHELAEIDITKVGYYQMVFAWRNNTYTSGKNPPAAVDNIKIARIKCTKPSHLEYSDLAAEGVTISWDAVEGATFEYALIPADTLGAFAEPTNYTPIDANTIVFDDLTEKTSYKFYLRKACGGDDGVSDAISIEFKTLPLPYSIPWSENFESMTPNAIPEYWDNTASSSYESTSTKYYIWGVYSYSSNKMIRMYNYYVQSGTALINTPQISLPASPTCLLSFDYSNLANCGPFTVKISTDGGVSWVDLKSFDQTGSTNATNPGTFTPAEIRLEGYEGETVMLQFFANANYGSGAIFVDNIKIEEAPSCVKPTDLAVIDSLTTTTTATITWTPGLDETNWLVQYKKSADSVWIFVPDSVKADTLVLAGLEPSSAYDVRVASWCNLTDSTAISEYSAAITVATLCEPYSIAEKCDFTEGFEAYVGVAYNATGVAPVCWETGGTSTYGIPHVVDKTVSSSYAYVHEGNKSMNFCASSNSYTYAVLPELVDSLKFLQIAFYAQMENATNGTLYLGYVDSASTFHDLVQFANHTSSMALYEAKFDTIPAEALRLAFVWYGASSSYYSCCIDDIKISYIPDCQKPENVAAIDSLATANSVVLKWDAQGSETAWAVQYKESTDSIWTSIVADNDTAFVIDGLKAATYYDVKVAALCGATDTSEYSIPVKSHTGCALINEFPYSENFDIMEGKTSGKNLPLCWSQINTGTNTTYNYYPMVYKGATYAQSGTNCLKFYMYNSTSATAGAYSDQYAILPEMEGISALRLRFNARKYSTSYDATFTVGVMTDPADASTYVALDTISPATTTYEPFRVLFNEYEGAGKYIAIKMALPTTSYKGAYIDDIVVDSIPNCLEPGDLEAVLTKGQGSIATLNWAAGTASAWEVQYGMKEDFTGAITVNVNEPTIHLTGLTSDSTYYARVKAICGENEESEWSNVISFTPMNAVIINDGTTTSNYVPFYGYYVDMGANSQFIIPEKEITTIQWDTITKLTFYCSSTYANQSWSGSQFEVYVAETTDSVLTSMAAWTDMKKVMNSKHIEVVNQQMVVAFDKPFQYQGGNLVIGFKETVTGDEGYCYWYGKSGVSGNSIYQYGTSSASKSNFNPKMKIDHVHGEMPTCFVVKNITVSDITPSSAVLNWTPGEEGQNAWQVVYSADPAFDLADITAEDIHDVTALPYAIAELATDTLYKVYVRANCSDGENEDYSLWSELFTFHTASACQTPDNVKADSITTTSALISWNTYGQTGFNLLYSDGTTIDTIYNVACPYVLEGLTPSTSYRVKVQAACAAADSVWSQMTTFKTAYGIPFSEKFPTTSIPADWNQYSGKFNADGSFDNTKSSTYSWVFGSYNGVFDSHTKLNICGTTTNKLLETPAIEISGDVQLTFDLALTKYSGTLTPITPGSQADDKFVVLVSTDNGANWTVLRQWDNAGSAYVYDNIPCSAEGEQVAISLAAYNGQSIKIGFYGESSVTGGDNNLHIDNVLIDLVPTCIKPTGLNISEIKAHKAKIAWTAGAEGQDAWQIAYATKATEKPDTLANILDVTANPYVLENLDPSTTYYVYVRANCGENDKSRWTDGKSFKTTVACPAPADLIAELTPGNGTIATLKWKAGGDEQAWRVEYSTNANLRDSIAVVVEDTVLNLTGLTAETTYYARVLADCGQLDSLSAYSAIINFTPTASYKLTVNEGTKTNGVVPINGINVDEEGTRSQFIIPEIDLEEIEWDTIKALTFYASQANVSWGNAQFEVYVAEAAETTISEEADWTTMTKVMNSASLSIVNNKMYVELDEPFQYQGGNLMIGFYKTVAGSYSTSTWYGITATGASIGGVGTGNKFGQQNFLPKMMIEYVPGQGPACPNPKLLKVIHVAGDSASFSWKAVQGAVWEYAYAPVGSELIEFNIVPEGANVITIHGLAENTQYTFYLRRACGEDGYSEVASVEFQTSELAEEISYDYSDDFEDATGWKFVNGTQTNAWMIGTGANNGGANALYISDDGGTYEYDDEASSVTYATKLFNFTRRGIFSVSYDYKCVGEYNDEDGAIDFMRVALIPATDQLVAGVQPGDLTKNTLPAGWSALDSAALVAQPNWTRKTELVEIPDYGLYRLVFVWINDDSFSDGAPAAIDNLYIQHKENPTGIESGAGIKSQAYKFIRDGHVYILINDVIYDATGRKVQ